MVSSMSLKSTPKPLRRSHVQCCSLKFPDLISWSAMMPALTYLCGKFLELAELCSKSLLQAGRLLGRSSLRGLQLLFRRCQITLDLGQAALQVSLSGCRRFCEPRTAKLSAAEKGHTIGYITADHSIQTAIEWIAGHAVKVMIQHSFRGFSKTMHELIMH